MIGYLGEFFLGQWVPVRELCQDASGDEAAPDAAPLATFYDDSFTPVTDHSDLKVPPIAQGDRTGLFNRDVQLDSNFSAGRYHVLVEYAVSSSNKSALFFFDVVDGGNAGGAYVAMFYYRRPHANYIVGQRDDGTLEFRRGPKL